MPKDQRLIIIGLLTLVVALVGIPEAGSTAPATRVRMEPADLVVDLNEPFVVQVVIEEANDLGAFQFNLTYDPSIVQVTEVVWGDFLESTGNSAVPVGPIVNNEEGKVTFGAFSLVSAAGPSGTGVLATITCIAQGEGSTALGLQEVQVLDTTLNVQPITVEDGRVVVRSAETPTPTVTAPPAPAATATPAPPPTATSAPAATATPVTAATVTPVPAVTTTPAPAATATPTPTNTPEAMDALTPAATALPSPTPSATSPAAETPTETPSPSPTPSSMPGVSIAPTETRPTEAATSLAVPTTEATQAPAATTTTPTSPPATPPPPSPSATPLPSPTPMSSPTPIPSLTPLATIPVPAATGSSSVGALGLMLAALAMAVLAVFILRRRPGG